jgi:hypothetical protein
MGIGLSVCRTIIGAHRGKLWAANNLERGATFYFSLPVNVSAVATPLPATPKNREGEPRRPFGSGTTGASRHSEAATKFSEADSNKELISDT